jgi:hypothetical protein
MKVLDELPVATLTFLVGIALVVVAYIGDDVGFEDAYKAVLYLGGGSGAIGYVRNQAGKGLKK